MFNFFDIGLVCILDGMWFDVMVMFSVGFVWIWGVCDVEGLVSCDDVFGYVVDIIMVILLLVNGDLENGFGDSLDVVVEMFKGVIEVGLVGCLIEDYL